LSYRINEDSVRDILSRLGKAQDPQDVLEYQILESMWYYRQSYKLKNMIEQIKDSRREMENNKYMTPEMERIYAVTKSYLAKLAGIFEEISNRTWGEFEKDAIRNNPHEEPFFNLIGAIYKGMVDEYRDCVSVISNKHTGREKKDDAAARFLYYEDFFNGTGVLRVLHDEIKIPDIMRRYIESYLWRRK